MIHSSINICQTLSPKNVRNRRATFGNDLTFLFGTLQSATSIILTYNSETELKSGIWGTHHIGKPWFGKPGNLNYSLGIWSACRFANFGSSDPESAAMERRSVRNLKYSKVSFKSFKIDDNQWSHYKLADLQSRTGSKRTLGFSKSFC